MNQLDETETLHGFSDGAIKELEKACLEYKNYIIDEAKKIERNDRNKSDNPEIITSHIREAKNKFRKFPHKKISIIVINVVFDLLVLLIGVLFDKERLLKNDKYLIFFVLLIFASIVIAVIKYSKEV